MQRKLALLLVPLLAATLWGCGSNRDSDSSSTPTVGVEDAASVGNCTLCHNIDVHTQANDLVGQNPNASGLGSFITHDCEACHGGGQYHHGEGPIPFPQPDLARCVTCHPFAADVPASVHGGGIAKCDGCHEPLLANLRTEDCSQCHNAAPTAANPFFGEISSRFATSRHATQSARAGFCSACHSHEGAVEFLAMGRKVAKEDLEAAYTADTADAYLLPVGSSTIDGVMKKSCATCHDPHKAALRGDGEISGSFTWDDDSDPVTPDVTEETVVYSAEFNLCTGCHMVDLVPTPAAHGDAGLLLSYELSDKYAAANLVDATSGTYDFTKAVFYHDGASGNGRTMVDTHFGGTILSHLVDFSGGNTDITIKGYNINAASKNACTICHDPHTAGKMLSIDASSTTAEYADVIDNKAISYAEGLGDFHTNYLGAAQGHGCLPCHSGDSFVPVTLGAALPSGSGTSAVGCRTCHNLAVPNATAGTNDSATFAAVREFQAGYEFKFTAAASSTYVPDTYAVDFPPFNGTLADGKYTATPAAVVTAAELGVNQICFECHKGRTAGIMPPTENKAGTMNYSISYLHYAPSMAILFGADSKMVLTYPGKTYAGRFQHYDGTEFGCVDCHDVHNTEGNHVAGNKMTNPDFPCAGCHGEGQANDAADLQARTEEFSVALLDAVYDAMIVAANGGVPNADLNDNLEAKLIEIYNAADEATGKELLMTYIKERQVYFPSRKIAHAATTWKVFTYEDGAPHGQTHGHGGSWAHNSEFARQVMFDAIESLGVDPNAVYGLTRPGSVL